MEDQVEIWKAHPDIVGIEVSSLGRVRTLDRTVPRKNGTYPVKGRILKQFVSNNGYLRVGVHINGKQTMKSVHRLVAQTFIQNPDNFPEVNHKDCDRKNNSAENLEFCTRSYNQKYRSKYGVSQTEAVGHPLFAINLKTLEVSHFHSQHEASRALGVLNQNINKVIKGERNKHHGYWFVSDDGHAVDVLKRKLHDIGGVGLKIK